jgi:pantoate--beta-alanine ligase
VAAARATSAGAQAALDAARSVLGAAPAIEVDYLELRDAELGPLQANRPGRLLVAARLGSTRLLDNIAIEVGNLAGTNERLKPVGPEEYVEAPWRN